MTRLNFSSKQEQHHVHQHQQRRQWQKRQRPRQPSKKIHPIVGCCGGAIMKLRILAAASIGLAVFALFSTGPLYRRALIQQQQQQRQGGGRSHGNAQELTPAARHLRMSIPDVSRHGYVPMNSLRTDVINEGDVLTLNINKEKRILSETKNRLVPVSASPRIVHIENYMDVKVLSKGGNDNTKIKIGKPRKVKAMSSSSSSSTMMPSSEKEPHSYTKDFEKPYHELCEPMMERPPIHSTCNDVHELTLERNGISVLSLKGSWRSIWKVDEVTNNTTEHQHSQDQNQSMLSAPFVLKMLHMKREFDVESYEAHEMDVMVMDKLTSSPHIVNAYGYCGQSVLTEYAPTGGREYVKSYDLKSRQRLKIARDLAQGLADLQALNHISSSSYHYYDKHSNSNKNNNKQQKNGHHHRDGQDAIDLERPVFAHNDINIANTVQINDNVKWNDFNIGVMMRQQQYNDSIMTCLAPVRFKGDLWRSPEEIHNTSYVDLPKADMYGFGNILYQVMTRHQPWTHKEPGGQLTVEQVAERKRNFTLPTIPEQYKNTTKPELQSLYLATMSCYHPNPAKRLSAYELATALSTVYETLKNKKKVTRKMLFELFVK